jgi:lipopolysaccharide export system permease protein
MRTHDRYVLRLYTRSLLLAILAFLVIYVTVDVFEQIDEWLDKEAALRDVLRYYYYSIPLMLSYVTPVAILLASIFAMGGLARRNELTALLAAGVSLKRVALPVLLASLGVSLLLILFDETVVVHANRERKEIKHFDIEHKKRLDPGLKKNLHYLGEEGMVILARRFVYATRTMDDVVVQQFRNNTLARRLEARRARWNGSHWVFYEGFDRTFEGDSERVEPFRQKVVPEIVERPEDFAKREVDRENMTVPELRDYIRKVARSGGEIAPYLTELYFRFSFPLAGAIFALLGVPLTARRRKISLASGFGQALVVSFLYYAVLRMGRSLGSQGVLPPLLGAQAGNILFMIVGGLLFWRAER